MSKGGVKNVQLWRLMMIAVVCWAVFAGVSRDMYANNEETYKGLKMFSEVLDIIKNDYVEEVDERELIDEAIKGMVQSLDPHSSFLSPEDLEDKQYEFESEFGGIGTQITIIEDVLTVISPIDGTPAAEAGIQAGDRIIKLDGELTKDMDFREIAKKMRGPKGSEITLTIWREGESEPIDFTLIRDIIPVESVRSVLIQEGFGYVRISIFREKTNADLTEALEELESGNAPLRGLIMDLRDNPGGVLDSAVGVADLFLEQGTIVSIKGRNDSDQSVFSAIPNKVQRDYPVVVLIGNGSASGSEIVAGALQDHKRALILGTSSFGKGSVQNMETLLDGYGLKLTIARYYTPSGRSIQAKGIEPDIVVEPKTIENSPEDTKNSLIIREKDLKNHIEPESRISGRGQTDKAEDNEETGDETETQKNKTSSSRAPIDPEDLKRDWQVVRALEILVSYDIFKGIDPQNQFHAS